MPGIVMPDDRDYAEDEAWRARSRERKCSLLRLAVTRSVALAMLWGATCAPGIAMDDDICRPKGRGPIVPIVLIWPGGVAVL
jgi:hypothetical protein